MITFAQRLQASTPVMTKTNNPKQLVDATLFAPTIRLDVRYATDDNFLGRAVYEKPRVFLAKSPAKALRRIARTLKKEGLGIILFDGYRPPAVVQTFWDETPDHLKKFLTNPAIGGRHCRGYSVDLTLYDLTTGKPLLMPSAYDDFTDKASPDYSGGTAEQRKNRDKLIAVMGKEGFSVHPCEWWHFDYPNWENQPIIKSTFDAIDQRFFHRIKKLFSRLYNAIRRILGLKDGKPLQDDDRRLNQISRSDALHIA
ncbi:MAG: M15 family metallopeptidase [Vampirovibrionales bacterium]|nr:M15 family metallopeptidase [Vampirovibrionales bacterium]